VVKDVSVTEQEEGKEMKTERKGSPELGRLLMGPSKGLVRETKLWHAIEAHYSFS
jgi:hypothetical protein